MPDDAPQHPGAYQQGMKWYVPLDSSNDPEPDDIPQELITKFMEYYDACEEQGGEFSLRRAILKKKGPEKDAITLHHTLTERQYRNHLNFTRTHGSHLQHQDFTCTRVGFDVDNGETRIITKRLCEILVRAGMKPFVSLSGGIAEGGERYHIDVFFTVPVRWNDAYRIGRKIVELLGTNIEAFPKQGESIPKEGEKINRGHWLKWPCGIHPITRQVCYFVDWKKNFEVITSRAEGIKRLERSDPSPFLAGITDAPTDTDKTEGPTPDFDQLEMRPCIRLAIMDKWDMHGKTGSHDFRMAVARELMVKNPDLTDGQIAEAFAHTTDFNQGLTLKHVASLRKYETPYKCSTIKEKCADFIGDMCERCTMKKKDKPKIAIGHRTLHELTDEALAAMELKQRKKPGIFVRAGMMVWVAEDERGAPTIKDMGEAAVRGEMDRAAHWYRPAMEGTGENAKRVEKTTIPPIDVVKDLMARPCTAWPFKPLLNITHTPIMHADGSMKATQGYDEDTQLYYAPTRGFQMPGIPERPTQADARAAVEVLKDIINEFPFVSETKAGKSSTADRDNALAAMITTPLRPMIYGPIPMALVDAPQAGTGKSLLCNAIERIATGLPPQQIAPPKKKEEMQKTITAVLRKGRPFAMFDNFEGKLNMPALAQVLTATIWEDRILGQTSMITLPATTVWIMNGNNIQLAGDMPRRCYRIRLDAMDAQPWLINGPGDEKEYKYDPLIPYVAQNRGEILKAVFTMTRAWILADRPPSTNPILGSYEEWSKILGGILEFAGVENFLGNLTDMYSDMDTDTDQWALFLSTWYAIQKIQVDWAGGITTAQLIAYMKKLSGERLVENLPPPLDGAWDGPEKRFAQIVGNVFASKRDTMFAPGYRLRKMGESHSARKWAVEKKGEPILC